MAKEKSIPQTIREESRWQTPEEVTAKVEQLVESGAVVPASLLPARAVNWKPSMDADLHDCPTNLDLTTWDGKAAVMQAASPGDYDFDAGGTLRIVATHYLIVPDERIDSETGEVSQFCRVVLFDKDGKHARTTAESGPARMRVAASLYSVKEWADGIPFIITVRLSRKTGRNYHDIRIERTAVFGK